MKLIIYITIFCFFSINLNAQKVVTFNFSSIFDNLHLYTEFVKKLEVFKKKKFDELKVEEQNLAIQKDKIEKSKILLSEKEYLDNVTKFNKDSFIFEKKVNKINNYLKSNLEMNEKIIFNEIAIIIKQIATENNIDIILSDDQYYLSSATVDISDLILIKLKNIDLKLQLTNFN